jgi:hypothetical protein
MSHQHLRVIREHDLAIGIAKERVASGGNVGAGSANVGHGDVLVIVKCCILRIDDCLPLDGEEVGVCGGNTHSGFLAAGLGVLRV